MRFKLLTVFFMVSSLGFSQATLSTLNEIADFAINNSLDSRRSQVSLDKAENDVVSYIKVDSTKVSTTGNYNQDGDITFNTSLNIPIVEQLSISGGVDGELNGSVSLNIDPIVHSNSVPLSVNNYDTALLNNVKILSSVEQNAVKAALDWMLGSRALELLDKQTQRYKTLYEDDKNRYSNGSITLDELQESLINWSNARKSLLEQKQSFYTLESNLYAQLGTTKESVIIEKLDLDDMIESLNQLYRLVESGSGDYLKDIDYQSAVLTSDKAKLTYNAIWVYDPDITGSIKLDLTDQGVSMDNFAASLNFSLSLDNVNYTEKKRAQEEYLISVKDRELKLDKARLDFEQCKDLVESSKIESEIFKFEYAQAEILLSEAVILYNAGEYSEIELLESKLFLEQAENNLLNSYKNEYLNLLDYLKYF
ncbi:MAG: TolC family protein [Spirochaetales bacterium]|nr:TolC family protein [Spirochaetales bacterium]